MEPEIEGLEILAEVGRGGFGTVYRATDSRFGRDVAVKVIRDSGLGENLVARFERECRALGALSGHPNIVTVHDSGQTGQGDLYLVMEYLAGGSFAERVAARGRADAQDVSFWGTALAGALETAHRSDIVHRDVKPENVLFSEYGVLKLVDFGIARMRSAYETRSGFFSASLSHAAPEIVAGGSVSPAADVYSLASTLFYMLTGQAPFERAGEETLVPLIARISTSPPPDLREDGVPPALAEVIEQGLAKDPAQRFGSAEGFGEALRAATTAMGNAPLPVPIGDPERIAVAASVVAGDDRDTPSSDTVHGARPSAVTPKQHLPESESQPAPVAEGRSRHPLVFASGVAIVALLAVGGFLIVSRDDPSPQTATPVASEGPLTVIDTPLETNGLRVERQYEISDAKNIGSTVVLSNTTRRRIDRIWFEVIPKELADDAADVLFSSPPDKIVQADPIVYWNVRLRPGTTRSISWSTPLAADAPANAQYLNRAIALHRIAIETNSGVIETALRQAEDTEDVEGVAPDRTVDKPGGGRDATTSFDETIPADGGTGSGGTGQAGTSPVGGTTGDSDGGNTTTDGDDAVAANRAPTVAVSNRTSDELASVAFSVGVSDPDGDKVSVSVSNLPPGVGVSGARVSGLVRYDAATTTTNRTTIRSRSFKVSVVASDGRGGKTTRTFDWVIRDTHRLMPNYIGQYGCAGCGGLPDVNAISKPIFKCAYDPEGDGDHIYRQGVAANNVIRWGQQITYWYGKNDSSCDKVAKGW